MGRTQHNLPTKIYAIDPAAAKSLLERAVKLNPYDAASWIQLGLLCEAANDLPQAEEALSRAANVDSTFLPSWSLANFYFRRENAGRSGTGRKGPPRWIRMTRRPLFRLAWYVNPNAREIENQLHMTRPFIEGQFVNFLITQGDPAQVTAAATHLLASGSQEGTETLLQACDWLLQRKRPDLALALWNGLAPRMSYPPLNADSPVTNGSFGRSPTSHGFDWHLMTVEGMSSFLNVDPNALGFEFSGEEPDSFTLMNQAVPVQAGKTMACCRLRNVRHCSRQRD